MDLAIWSSWLQTHTPQALPWPNGLCSQSLGTAYTPFALVWLFVFYCPAYFPYLTMLAPSLTLNFTWFLPRTTASPFPCPRMCLISSNSSILSSGFLLCSLEHGSFLSELLLSLSYCASQSLSKHLPSFKSSCEEWQTEAQEWTIPELNLTWKLLLWGQPVIEKKGAL